MNFTKCMREGTTKGSMKFDIVWEYCIQEEARVANREPKGYFGKYSKHVSNG